MVNCAGEPDALALFLQQSEDNASQVISEMNTQIQFCSNSMCVSTINKFKFTQIPEDINYHSSVNPATEPAEGRVGCGAVTGIPPTNCCF